LILYKSM
jgi:hypothetical protein